MMASSWLRALVAAGAGRSRRPRSLGGMGVTTLAESAAQVLQHTRVREGPVGFLIDGAHALHDHALEQLEQNDADLDVEVDVLDGAAEGFAEGLGAQGIAPLVDGRVLGQVVQALGQLHDRQ